MSNESSARRVTLRQVADRAGVSLATASKVMNGREGISEATRSAVSAIAADAGYTPRLKEQPPPRRVLIRLQGLDSPYVIHVLEGAEHAARRAGVELLIQSAERRPGERAPITRAWMEQMSTRGLEGVIAVTTPVSQTHARWSRELELPLIVIDPIMVDTDGPASDVPGLFTISSTNWEGSTEAVRHLLDLGHRRIGILAGPENSVPGQQREQGYQSALSQAGVPFDSNLVRYGEFDFASGHQGAQELLALEEPPTAFFAASDGLGVGVLRAAHEHGLSVPKDLSVVCFDDTMITRWAQPQLTAVRQPLFSMGQVAVERLLALSSDPGLFAHPFKLETQLIERESTAALDTAGDSAVD